MAEFVLDTGAVSSAAASIESMSAELESLASTVNGYDVSCEDFDFAGPKSVIASNLSACAQKIKNAVAILNEVVASHTNLQNSLNFEASTAGADTTSASYGSGSTTTDGTTSTGGTTSGSSSSGGSYSGGSYSGGSSSGGSSSGGSSSGAAAVVTTTAGTLTPTVTSTEQTNPTPIETQTSTPVQTVVQQPTEQVVYTQQEPQYVTTQEAPPVDNSQSAYVDPSDVSKYSETTSRVIGDINIEHPTIHTAAIKEGAEIPKDSQKLFKDPFFKYDDSGYAVIDDTYVVSCTKEYGQVGDEVIFSLEDGSQVRCVIGEVRNSSDKDVWFFTDFKNRTSTSELFTKSLSSKIVKIENTGINTITVDKKIDRAVNLAIQTSQSGSVTKTDDYVSYIIRSYDSVGIPINTSGTDHSVHTMLTNSGFKWTEGSPEMSSLSAGDIIVTKNDNVLMYAGDGRLVVDYNTFDQRTDENGNQVPIIDDGELEIKGVYHYQYNQGTVSTGNFSQIDSSLGNQQLGPNGEQPGQVGPNGETPGQASPGGQQSGPVGPNGEQPGQAGPNGELPPDAQV